MQAPAKLISYLHPTFHLSHPTPPIFVWNNLLRYSRHLPHTTPLDLYRRMRHHSISPDFYTFPYLLHSFTTPAHFPSGMATHAHIILSGFASDHFVHCSLISMYVNCDCLRFAQQVFDEIAHPDLPTWNAIMKGMVRSGLVGHARRLFEGMPERNVVSWSCLIDGFVKAGEHREAIELFRLMQRDEGRVRPNEFTMTSVFAACGQLGAIEHGSWAHAYAERCGLRVDVVLGTSLIDMYAKCGSIEKAKCLFDSLGDRKDVMAWGAMISGLGMHGKGRECIDLFEKMLGEGVRPNDVTLLGVLCGCAHGGLVEEGKNIFHRMVDTYGVIPKIQHYGCMVDLYGRAGLINDAWMVIDSMPMKQDVLIWGALLSGARLQGDIKTCEVALRQLIELESTNSSAYVLLANVYSKTGRWEEAKKVRNLMQIRQIRKAPGCSLVEIDGTVHEFFCGDQTHEDSEEIYDMLEEIIRKLKLVGYVGNTKEALLDLDEEGKEWALSLHSERLAIAFCFIKTGPGTPIRIVKNLRICFDCHVAIKLISNIFHREITVRDCNRFHHFKNGACSCNDYW